MPRELGICSTHGDTLFRYVGAGGSQIMCRLSGCRAALVPPSELNQPGPKAQALLELQAVIERALAAGLTPTLLSRAFSTALAEHPASPKAQERPGATS